MREIEPIGSHEIFSLDCSKTDNLAFCAISSESITTEGKERVLAHLFVSSSITLDTDSLDREESSKSLGDLIVKTSFTDLFDEDLIGVLSDLDLCTSDFSENANSETRSWERVSHDEVLGNVKESSECSYLV